MKQLPAVLIAWAITQSAFADEIRLSGKSMGTTWSVVLVGTPDRAAASVAIAAELDRVDSLMSTWRDDSEISRFNAAETTEWFPVSSETVVVVSAAQEIAESTAGAFDVTVAPLVALWHFNDRSGDRSIPDSSSIEALQRHTGWRKLRVRSKPPALRKEDPALSVNLSAIAKGFAVDRVAQAVAQLDGVEAALVEIGGEVRTLGTKASGEPWMIGVESPSPDRRELLSAVPVSDRSVATSGDYRNFFTVDGKRYSHTIDPRSGRPVEHQLASVSVMADSCMMADAWATALMVLGPAGVDTARQNRLDAFFVIRDGDEVTTTGVGAFPEPTKRLEGTVANEKDPEGGTWQPFVAALVIFLIAVTGMAIGVIVSNRRLKGSCGGLAGMTDSEGKTACDLCTVPSPTCQGPESQEDAVTG